MVRIPVANVIAIISARRAIGRYIVDLRGGGKVWDKTEHDRHPADAGAGLGVGRGTGRGT